MEDSTEQLLTLGQNPEVVCETVRKAIAGYVEAKQRTGIAGNNKNLSLGVTIPNPTAGVVEEIARYVTEALIKHADKRSWRMIKTSEMIAGDVFTLYDLVNQKPVTMEVTVLMVESVGRVRKVRFSRKNGDHGEVKATDDYLFYVHRPTAADVKNALRIELELDASIARTEARR